MDLGLSGKLALVTGGSAGIGRATAAMLLEEGARVIIAGRNPKRLEAAHRELAARGEAYRLVGDLGNADDSERLANEAERLGEIDILINNAGVFPAAAFFSSNDQAWTDMFEINVMGPVRLARALMPGMLRRKRGRVIFIGSEQSVRPDPDMIPYSMTKAAILSIARGLAELTKGTEVTVNSVLPGPVWTEGAARFYGNAAAAGLPPPAANAYFDEPGGRDSLIRRFTTPEEVAAVIAFLCARKAASVNGAAYRVDGGIVRTMA
jgi:NAD(P)-dependent dehydrogenase (short-subunit alcohol dehydrogenase family)